MWDLLLEMSNLREKNTIRSDSLMQTIWSIWLDLVQPTHKCLLIEPYTHFSYDAHSLVMAMLNLYSILNCMVLYKWLFCSVFDQIRKTRATVNGNRTRNWIETTSSSCLIFADNLVTADCGASIIVHLIWCGKSIQIGFSDYYLQVVMSWTPSLMSS